MWVISEAFVDYLVRMENSHQLILNSTSPNQILESGHLHQLAHLPRPSRVSLSLYLFLLLLLFFGSLLMLHCINLIDLWSCFSVPVLEYRGTRE